MIIKKTVTLGEEQIRYEAHLQGHLDADFNGTVVVHDPDNLGGRRRAFLLPTDQTPPAGHVVICRLAVKY